MRAYSLDLRERVLAAVDAKEGTWKEIAARFRVSVPWITRMARQRKELGTLEVQTHRCGRKRKLTEEHHQQLAEDSDATLKELRERLGVTCCLEVIWDALNRLGLTYKKIGPSRGTRTPRRPRAA
jgi:transposase